MTTPSDEPRTVRARSPWPEVRTRADEAAWRATVQERLDHLDDGQDQILALLSRRGALARVLTTALGREGRNVPWLVAGLVALAVIVGGVSAVVSYGEFELSTGGRGAGGNDGTAAVAPSPVSVLEQELTP